MPGRYVEGAGENATATRILIRAAALQQVAGLAVQVVLLGGLGFGRGSARFHGLATAEQSGLLAYGNATDLFDYDR